MGVYVSSVKEKFKPVRGLTDGWVAPKSNESHHGICAKDCKPLVAN